MNQPDQTRQTKRRYFVAYFASRQWHSKRQRPFHKRMTKDRPMQDVFPRHSRRLEISISNSFFCRCSHKLSSEQFYIWDLWCPIWNIAKGKTRTQRMEYFDSINTFSSNNKLWNLGYTSAWFCLAKAEIWIKQLWQIYVIILINTCRNFEKIHVTT